MAFKCFSLFGTSNKRLKAYMTIVFSHIVIIKHLCLLLRLTNTATKSFSITICNVQLWFLQRKKPIANLHVRFVLAMCFSDCVETSRLENAERTDRTFHLYFTKFTSSSITIKPIPLMYFARKETSAPTGISS